jgi:superfamily II RNA helicase
MREQFRPRKLSPYVEKARERFLSGIGVPEKTGPFVPDRFQREAISSVVNGQDTLVVAPTGSGKTYIALESIEAMLQLRCRSVYTSPLKALSNTKYTEFTRRFEPAHTVGLLTGDRKIDTDADIVVATTEIYRNELYSGAGNYSLAVLDDVHFIADLQRGAVWEESIILTHSDSTLLMLSASISNAQEIAAWIEDVRGKPCTIITETVRPVELRLGFIHPREGVLPLSDESGRIFRDVEYFYSSMSLDPTGRRLQREGSGRGGHTHGRGRDGGEGRPGKRKRFATRGRNSGRGRR